MKYSFQGRLLVASLFSLALIGCSNDSNDSDDSGSGDDVLRLINSLAVEGLVVTYKYPKDDPIVEETVTLIATGGPGPETLESVTFIKDVIFNFKASWQGLDGDVDCTVGQAADSIGAADVLVYPSGNLIEIDCVSNWQ